MTRQKYEKVWVCPNCKNINKLLDCKITKEVLSATDFIQVVPNPPSRKDGMIDRTNFHIKFSVWFWSFLVELEAQAAQFRDDNWVKSGSEGELESVDTDGLGEG